LPVISLGAIPTGPQRLDLRPDGALERATVGDWTVDREDLVLADDDGVLFVPLAVAADVFSLAETIRDAEARQAERMRGGISLRNQVQFDTYLAEHQKTPSLTFRDHLREVGGAIEVRPRITCSPLPDSPVRLSRRGKAFRRLNRRVSHLIPGWRTGLPRPVLLLQAGNTLHYFG